MPGRRSARGLVGAHDHARDVTELVQRPGGHQADDRGTVGVGDQPVVPGDVLGVDLRDDEGHVLVEAEGVAVVHHGGTSAHGLGQELLGNVVAGGAQHDVHAIEGLGLCLDELDLPPAPLDLLAAERALASRRSSPTGKSRSARHWSICVPTAPVAPRIATFFLSAMAPMPPRRGTRRTPHESCPRSRCCSRQR